MYVMQTCPDCEYVEKQWMWDWSRDHRKRVLHAVSMEEVAKEN